MVGFESKGVRRLARILLFSREMKRTSSRADRGHEEKREQIQELFRRLSEVSDVIEGESERECELSSKTAKFLVCVT